MRLRIVIRRSLCLAYGLVFLLCGCSKSVSISSKDNAPVTINFWHYYKGSQLKILEEQINTLTPM